jgi:hypothetical protein
MADRFGAQWPVRQKQKPPLLSNRRWGPKNSEPFAPAVPGKTEAILGEQSH